MQSNAPLVFLDTNAFSSATESKVQQRADLIPGKLTPADGGPSKDITIVKHSNHPRPRKSAGTEEPLMRYMAEAARSGKLRACISHEVTLELLFQPQIPTQFYRAPVHRVPSPRDYRPAGFHRFPDRNDFGAFLMTGTQEFHQYEQLLRARPQEASRLVEDFLLRLPDRGFLLHHDFRTFWNGARAPSKVRLSAAEFLLPHLQRITDQSFQDLLKELEAVAPNGDPDPNSYVDAFLLWTAEEAGCTYFLTIDKKIRARYQSGAVKAVKPSELLALL
ncbi:MAG: type II toxin-antitoxin system VapC family toxin [bacterium]|nr:type II toxin-antitoxin system VapC family toxin [bacterium]